MLDLHQIFTFAIAAFLIVIVPGPNMTYLISCAISQGKKGAIFALLGSNAALLTLGIITGMGLSTLLKSVPVIYEALKIVGAFYLFWLAWKAIQSNKKDKISTVSVPQHSKGTLFKRGYLTNLLNPKSAAFYVAIFPEFLNVHNGYLVLQGAMLGLVHAVVSFIINGTIILFVRQVALRVGSGNKLQVVKKWLTASIFTAFGIRMLLQKNN